MKNLRKDAGARTLRRTVLALCVSLMACAEEYDVLVEFDDPQSREAAQTIETSVVASCASQALGDAPVEALGSSVVAEVDATAAALGSYPPGSYGLYVRVVDANCRVVAAGCSPVVLRSGEGAELRVRVAPIEPVCAAFAGCACNDTDGGIDADQGRGELGVDTGPPVDAGVDAAMPDAGADAGLDAELDTGPVDTGPVDMGAVDPDLLAHYDCEDLAGGLLRDRSGNARDITCEAGCTTTTGVGVAGNGCDFDGSLQGAFSLSRSDAFEPMPAYSVSLWIRPSEASDMSPIAIPFGDDSTSNTYQVRLQLLGEFVATHVYHDTTRRGQSAPIAVDAWNHIVITHSGSEAAIYVDGALVSESSAAGPVTYRGGPLIVGADENRRVAALPYEGLLDEVRIYRRALTREEVRALFLSPEG